MDMIALFLSIFTSRLSCFYLVKKFYQVILTQKASIKKIGDGEIVQPTAQKKYVEFFENDDLNWKEIYSLPYQVALDT